ncbi:RNA polymerase Rpb4-domain-containing protein [Rhodocollybia butyracea]|uniref:DNA-directed RNA polymerase III subunit RPC9 n=1 Tax=Rhodocollybia butyracea TaxID=206335 RepID=A0A9P5Q104_9AGAR|nr:RNA polymerase Rpb4-domain-containing protein [Rhodocollybia butyracea]
MEVVNARSALLSNFEVFEFLREQENDHKARQKTAQRIKKEEEASGISVAKHVSAVEIAENVRTIQFEAIQHLSADYQPTRRQTETGITKLVKDLANYDLTKAEKLQIVNLAPTRPVELYVIVEELEDRVSDMEVILDMVASSLSTEPVPPTNGFSKLLPSESDSAGVLYPEDNDVHMVDEANGLEFDDTGEGVGVEGDLDKEDD